jgi:energy-coupling factor transport system substrate-specific component
MKRNSLYIAIILVIGTAGFIIPLYPVELLPSFFNWSITATLLVMITIIAFLKRFEISAVSSKEIALVAMLGTISAVFRIPFAALPSIQPCTYLIICTGYVFGPMAGFMVGALTPLVSNFFLGQGPWTPYQMFAWGLAGMTSPFIKRVNENMWTIIIFSVLWGYLYGWIMNIWYWTAFIYPLTMKSFLMTQLITIWFDTMHAAGNALFMGILGHRTIVILERFKRRFTWTKATN